MFFFRIGFCLNTFGELQLTVNSQTAGSLLTDLPTDIPLWVIIDVYGSTQSVQFIQVQGRFVDDYTMYDFHISTDTLKF